MAPETLALVLDLVEWVAAQPRPYEEVMGAWRTSCPRLPVWEDAIDGGLIEQRRRDGNGTMVHATPAGRALLAQEGR